MSQERTEKATPKRREDARKKGQIARGAEFPAALGFLAALSTINLLGGDIFRKVGFYIQSSARHITDVKVLTTADAQDLFLEAGKIFSMLVLPVITVIFAAVLGGNFVQGGFAFTAKALKPKTERFNPIQNAKRIFGLDSLVNLIKSFLKLLLIGAVAYEVLNPIIMDAPTFIHAPIGTLVAKLGGTLYSLALRCGLVLLALALADYGYARYKHEKSLRMTKQEIRDEFKEQEGDPLVKSQRRRAARALTQKRSLAEVQTASVVITNPTHLAIALRYDREKDAAPIVVAKGADHIAAKIREIARENGVPLVENKPLARALFKTVEPNQIIPIEFFGAVAEILAYVFRQREA